MFVCEVRIGAARGDEVMFFTYNDPCHVHLPRLGRDIFLDAGRGLRSSQGTAFEVYPGASIKDWATLFTGPVGLVLNAAQCRTWCCEEQYGR